MGKIAGRLVKLNVGSTPAELPAFDFGLNETAQELDVSDSASGDSTEFITGFFTREFSFSLWFKDDATNIPEVASTIEAELVVGAKKFSGNIVILSRNLSAKREDAVRMDYTGKFSGQITLT